MTSLGLIAILAKIMEGVSIGLELTSLWNEGTRLVKRLQEQDRDPEASELNAIISNVQARGDQIDRIEL